MFFQPMSGSVFAQENMTVCVAVGFLWLFFNVPVTQSQCDSDGLPTVSPSVLLPYLLSCLESAISDCLDKKYCVVKAGLGKKKYFEIKTPINNNEKPMSNFQSISQHCCTITQLDLSMLVM